MENITLLPARVNNTIFKAQRKDCAGGCIILEDRVTEYVMTIDDTTAVSVDTSLLNQPYNSTIEFDLYVYSTKSNMINFDGFSIQQLEVGHGESIFHVYSSNGKWILIPKQIAGYKQQVLKAGCCPNNRSTPEPGVNFWGILSLTGNEEQEGNYSNIFDNNAMFGVEHTTYSGRFYKDLGDIICYVRYPSPVMVTNLAMMFHRDCGSDMPDSVTIWGSNDGENWSQILYTTVTEKTNGKHYMFDVSAYGFYELLKFQFHFNPNAGYSYYYLPLMQIIGFRSETHYRFVRAMPELSGNPPCNGYNIEFGNENTWDRDIVYRLTQVEVEGNCNIYRPNQQVPWTIIYSFPEAFRAYAFFHCARYTNGNLAEFKLYGSHDKKNWVEFYHYKKDRGDLSIRYRNYGYRTFFVDSIYDYKYYKVEVYQTRNNENISYACSYHFMQKLKLDYLGFDTNIPKLTSNNENGYKLSSTNIVTGNLYNLFNQNPTSYMEADLENGQWELTIKLPQSTKYNRLSFRNYKDETYRNPIRFKILGSNDDEEYEELREWTETLWRWDNSRPQTESYHFANDTAYRYYKLVILQVRSGTRIRMYDVGLSYDAPWIEAPYYKLDYLVPVMNSNSMNGYIATSSSILSGTYANWKAFDRTINNYEDTWIARPNTDSSGNCDEWLQIQLPEAKKANRLQLVGRNSFNNRSPKDFTLQASNDGENWDILLTQTDQVYSSKEWEFENDTAYSYYRLCITKTNEPGSDVSVGQMNLSFYQEFKKLYQEIRDDDYLIPELRSNNHMGYTVTASSYLTEGSREYAPYLAFNRKYGNQYNSWIAANNQSGDGVTDEWIQVQLPIAKVCNKIKLAAQYASGIYTNNAARDFTFKGSNDGENWTTLYTATDQTYTSIIANEYTFENENAYTYYRLCITKTVGTGSTDKAALSVLMLCYQHAHADRYVIDDDERLVPGGLNSANAFSSAGYYITASSQYNNDYVPWKAFYAYCNNEKDAWAPSTSEKSDAGGNCNCWIQIQLPEAKICNRVILRFRVYTYHYELPYEFEVLGSNDGENFDTLVEYKGHEMYQREYSVDFDNETSYLYYRIHVSKIPQGNDVAAIGYISLKRRIFEPIPEEIVEPVEEEQEEGGEGQGEENNNEESNVSEGE